MKVKYVVAGENKKRGPKMYGVLRFKTIDRGWQVNVWPCDMDGNPVNWPIEYEDGLNWFEAIHLFNKHYKGYNKYVNGRR